MEVDSFDSGDDDEFTRADLVGMSVIFATWDIFSNLQTFNHSCLLSVHFKKTSLFIDSQWRNKVFLE